ncbi:MAG: hypothetical protein CM15mP25_4400 [Gammaproteobacteria bacterium]|nr:MAG: hypothetical protein CM15mP25_4400 [Gammaproteobacteria bacterium]
MPAARDQRSTTQCTPISTKDICALCAVDREQLPSSKCGRLLRVGRRYISATKECQHEGFGNDALRLSISPASVDMDS